MIESLEESQKNTKIPYNIDELRRNLKNRNNPESSIKKIKLVPKYKFVIPTPSHRSFNTIHNSQVETAEDYIEKLKQYKLNGNSEKYNKHVKYINDVMNESNTPTQWVKIVYNYIKNQ